MVCRYGGPDTIQSGRHVVSYHEYKDAAGQGVVAAQLEDGAWCVRGWLGQGVAVWS